MIKKILILCLLSSSFLIQACVPVVIAGAAAGGLMLNDRRDVNMMIRDKRIQQAILSKFTRDSMFQKAHITIAVLNGTILICGQAPNAEIRDEALRIVNSVSHRRIYNQLRIQQPTSIQTRAQDSLITTKIKAAMITQHGLHSMQIKIITEEGIVYLMGIVQPEQGNLAAQVARRVPGVQKVVKLFEYIK